MTAHAQNACSSSSVRLRRLPVPRVFGPDPRAGLFHDGAYQRLAARGELLTGRGGRRRRQARGRIGAFLLRGGDQAAAVRAGVRGSAGQCVTCGG